MPVVIVVAVTIVLILLRSQIQQLRDYGYAGVFLIGMLSSATVFVPLPGMAVVFVMGSVLNPALVGLSAGAGAAIGEMVGYVAGYGGSMVVNAERWQSYRRVEDLVARKGGIIIFLAACVPNPLFDVVGIAAGALKMPPWRFLMFCWPGVTVKNLMTAFGGYYGLNFLLRFI